MCWLKGNERPAGRLDANQARGPNPHFQENSLRAGDVGKERLMVDEVMPWIREQIHLSRLSCAI